MYIPPGHDETHYTLELILKLNRRCYWEEQEDTHTYYVETEMKIHTLSHIHVFVFYADGKLQDETQV